MSYEMPKSVNILGVKYKIELKNVSDDWKLKNGSNAYTDCYEKKIIIAILDDEINYPYASHNPSHAEFRYKHELKHEITHAFFNECGIGHSAKMETTNWISNETLVDWISIQAPKLYKIWEKLGLLD